MQEDKEKKRLEALERKKENQRLLDEEDVKTRGKAAREEAAAAAGKLTRAQIEDSLRKDQEPKPPEAVEKGERILLSL